MQSKISSLLQSRASALLGASLLALMAFVTTYQLLNQTPFANGWDSYFYLIQIKSIVQEGSMHSADMSLVYPLLLLLFKVVGEYTLAYKILSSLLVALFVLVVGCVGWQSTGKKSLAFLLMTVALCSPQLGYVAAQYPKNLLGVTLFLLLIAASFRSNTFVIVGLLLLNFFGHRMTAVLSTVYLGCYYVLRYRQGKMVLWVLFISGFAFFAGLFIPGLLSPFDIERFHALFSVKPLFPPVVYAESIGGVSWLWRWELLFLTLGYAVALGGVLWKRLWQERPQGTAGLILLGVLVFPWYHWESNGIALRLFTIFPLIAPVVIIGFLRVKTSSKMQWGGALVILLCAVVILRGNYGYNPRFHDPNYTHFKQLTKACFDRVDTSEVELLIAHKSLAEFLTFSTGVDALPWEVEYPVPKEKLWRIATDVEREMLIHYSRESEHPFIHQIGVNYYLVREDVWKNIIQKLTAESDRESLGRLKTWRNPHVIRPVYLLKNKK